MVKVRVIHGCNMGLKPYLTQDEEKELVDFLLNCDMNQCTAVWVIIYSKVATDTNRLMMDPTKHSLYTQ